jgi:uncharacterized membrane protein YraQ (UPF0718 family)
MIQRILNVLKDSVLNILFVLAILAIIYVGMNVQFDVHLPDLSDAWTTVKGMIRPAESIFLAILVESLPFVVLGALVASIIQEFVSEQRIVRWLPRNRFLSVLVGGTLGFVIPVCDCGTIPIARSLLRKGASIGAATAFTLAAPVINPVTIAATYVAFGFNLHVALLRVLCTYAVACAIGLITAAIGGKRPTIDSAMPEVAVTAEKAPSARLSYSAVWRRLKHIVDHTVSEFFGIAGVLICSAGVASLFQVYHSQHAHFGQVHSGFPAVATMMGLAILFSLCSEADAFVARSFAASYAPGSVLAFMLIGQMADLRNLFLIPRTFGIRLGVLIILLAMALCFGIGILV